MTEFNGPPADKKPTEARSNMPRHPSHVPFKFDVNKRKSKPPKGFFEQLKRKIK